MAMHSKTILLLLSGFDEKFLLVEHPCSLDGTGEQGNSNVSHIFGLVGTNACEASHKKRVIDFTRRFAFSDRLIHIYDTMVEVYNYGEQVSSYTWPGEVKSTCGYLSLAFDHPGALRT
jgi:hypothetical protein